jgi:hypothetical protein
MDERRQAPFCASFTHSAANSRKLLETAFSGNLIQVNAMPRILKIHHFAVTGCLVILLAGCGGSDSVSAVGGDADEHGCVGSAGYRWCEATQRCARPWELAEAEGFDNTAEAFDAFCTAASDEASRG